MGKVSTTIPLCSLADGQMIPVEVDGVNVLLCKVAGEYYALADRCSHAKQALSTGKLKGFEISCPLHGARFDIRDGKCLGPPATQSVASYAICIKNDVAMIDVSDN